MTAHARTTDWHIFQLAASGLTPAQVAARTGTTETRAAATIRKQAERQRDPDPAPDIYETVAPDDDPQGPTERQTDPLTYEEAIGRRSTQNDTPVSPEGDAAYWRARAEAAEDREINWIARCDNARTMAALWKETARRAIRTPVTLARWEKDLLVEDFKSNGPVYTTGERDRHRAQIERVEQERDDARHDVIAYRSALSRVCAALGIADDASTDDMVEKAECHDCDTTVTDAKVDRAWHVSNTLREDRWPSREEVRQIVTAAAHAIEQVYPKENR